MKYFKFQMELAYLYKNLICFISSETGCILTTIVIVVFVKSAELAAITCTITITSSAVASSIVVGTKSTVTAIAENVQMAETVNAQMATKIGTCYCFIPSSNNRPVAKP